jgi:hypothetical protein
MIRRYLLTTEPRIQSQVRFLADKMALEQVLLRDYSGLIIIPSLVHSHLLPPSEKFGGFDQAAHYHIPVL